MSNKTLSKKVSEQIKYFDYLDKESILVQALVNKEQQLPYYKFGLAVNDQESDQDKWIESLNRTELFKDFANYLEYTPRYSVMSLSDWINEYGAATKCDIEEEFKNDPQQKESRLLDLSKTIDGLLVWAIDEPMKVMIYGRGED